MLSSRKRGIFYWRSKPASHAPMPSMKFRSQQLVWMGEEKRFRRKAWRPPIPCCSERELGMASGGLSTRAYPGAFCCPSAPAVKKRE